MAVSGGIDSVALLHLLAQRPELKLTVAHFDHGIREDSAEDRRLVEELARRYNLPFVYHMGMLGEEASEAEARAARYDFLHKVREASGADAIITAHHQDDVLETAILNMLRGTNRRGLSSLKSTGVVRRPLLHMPKKELLRYAGREGLQWREDSTNSDEKYLRNYVRKYILPRFAESDREVLLGHIYTAHVINREMAEHLVNYLHMQPGMLSLRRQDFIMLPHVIAREVMAEWLLLRAGAEISKAMLERLVISAKTGRTGSKVDVDANYWLAIEQHSLALQPRER